MISMTIRLGLNKGKLMSTVYSENNIALMIFLSFANCLPNAVDLSASITYNNVVLIGNLNSKGTMKANVFLETHFVRN